ncbi:hypothetical protein N7493_006395 [Penicillium malachiteum]|uniref:Peptidase A1 domain-containing protein n=1 Tax=Penicillium malachiteum TaxID=1324776 RepID=A0AAD6MVH1_9EURO|nr:hypothetical protein N7493_006395 [Penicillium malachiteum]
MYGETTCYAESSGSFERNESSTASDYISTGWSTCGDCGNSVPGESYRGIFWDTYSLGSTTTVPNVSTAGMSETYQEYPDGRKFPFPAGVLSLGAPAPSHVWDGYTMIFISAYLYTTGSADATTSSYSYGMHIGSVPLGISGSFLLGGYDSNRVMGVVSAQPFTPFGNNPGGELTIGLQDIGLGVAEGGSPWNFTSKEGLLSYSNSSIIPPVTLPVRFNESLGLYLWEDSDESQTIVKPPAYLSFMFERDSSNNQTIIIKVPFMLLNLTLEAPLVDKSTSYFPCYPINSSYMIGRAFLQAAFIAQNYGTGDDTTVVEESDSTLPNTTSSWENTWRAYWTALPSNTTNSTDSATSTSTSSSTASSASTSTGFSLGVKIGIGAGCGAAGVALIFTIAWLIMKSRRRQARQKAAVNDLRRSESPSRMIQYIPRELGNHFTRSPRELNGGHATIPRELTGGCATLPRELSCGSATIPQELSATRTPNPQGLGLDIVPGTSYGDYAWPLEKNRNWQYYEAP